MINRKLKTSILLFFTVAIFNINYFSINAVELNSSSYTVTDTDYAGKQMDSTNFSVTGDISQGLRGSFVSDSLPLVPGNITSCGKITTPGTYTLTQNLTGISGTCFFIQANNVVIEGAGFNVNANGSNNSYAVVATSSISAGSAYGTTTIQNITFVGFAAGINASGNNASSGNTNGGNGSSIIVSSSTLGNILTSGGQGFGTGIIGNGSNVVINESTTGNIINLGANSSISLTADDLNISNKTYTTTGTLSFSYTNSITTTNTTLSSVQHFVVLGNDYGSYTGGSFPLFPGNINACGNLYFSGTYTLTGNTSTNCNIVKTGVIIDGAGFTINGNITANNHGVTLSDIVVTGTISTTGAGAGALNIINSSNLTGSISVTGAINGDGTSSLGNTTINTGGSVSTSSVSFVGNVLNNGTIHFGNSVVGKTTNNSIINSGSNYFSFNATSTNSGTVNGNATFNASSTNSGTVTGDAVFNAFTANSGQVTFEGTTVFAGIGFIGGNVYDSTGVSTINTWIFNASSTNSGVLKGDAVFNNTSRNTVTGIVQGDAVFNDSSLNQGTVTGNVDVYSPVIRPLTGTVNGQIVYYNYAGLYYNDTAVGHGVVGKWDDINNWWTDINSTIHSPVIPTEGDDVIIISGNISTTTISANVKSIVFQNNTNNGIYITVQSTSTQAALFNASSTNSGTINGNATFSGPDTENTGTVTGFITRQYNAGTYVVLTDFTHNGVHWIVQAINGASVDLTGATYSLITNIFQAFNNAVFIWNNLIGTNNPSLSVASPVAGTNIKWKPIVSWDTGTICQYKIDGGNYTSVNCANNGSDIPRPTAGSHTILLKSSINGNVTEKSISFTYDNTQPIDTDCSSPLDESTRPYYYLTANVGDCSIATTTTLRGDDNGGGNYYTIGNISGSGADDIVLQNITATGTVSGFGDITISSSTLSGSIEIDGIFTSDNISTFGNTTISSTGVVNSGNFIANLTNNGIITNSTSTPVIVFGNTINNGTINNSFIFNATSTNTGTVNGTTTLNDTSVNTGTVNGNLIFNTLTSVSNTVTFENNTNFLGTGIVTGYMLDNRGELINLWSFKDITSNTGYIQGDVFFNGTSTNIGTVSGDAYFSDASVNSGIIEGDAYKYNAYLIAHALGGTVNGATTYYSYPNSVSFKNVSGDNDWNNISNWFAYATSSIPLTRLPIDNEKIVLFASTTLKNNITNNIYIALSSTILNGGNYTLTGNIYGNGPYGGHDAYDFELEAITVTGTTTAIGGDGTPSIDGGNGGNVIVRNSSTGVIAVNGGDPLHNGGDAGTIYVYNTIAIAPNTLITAIGGDSIGCGFGGSGGNVTLIDTSDYVLVVDPGRSATTTVAQGGGCVNPPVGNGGTPGQTSVTGTYNAPVNTPVNTNNNNNVNNNNITYRSSTVAKIIKKIENIIPAVNFEIKISPFSFKPLPVFGNGKNGTFSFWTGINNFLALDTPKNIVITYADIPGFLSNFGLNNMNDFILLRYNPLLISNTKIKGLFTVYSKDLTTPFQTYLNFNLNNTLYQSVKVPANKEIIITLIPTVNRNAYIGLFNDKNISFVDNKVTIITPSRMGSYTLKTSASPVFLKIQVVDEKGNTSSEEMVSESIFTKIINCIKTFIRRFFLL